MKYIRNNLLYLILVSQPLLDILAYFQEGSSLSIAGYVRLAYTICVPLYALFAMKDKTNRKKFFGIMCVIGAYCVLHIANGFRVGYIGLFSDVKYMLLVIHMPVLLFSFKYLYNKEENLEQITRALRANIVIIAIAFFASYVLKSGNYTYADYELGWTGWYVIPNAQSVIMVSLLPFIVYFLLKYFKKTFPIPMLAVIFMYLSNGTKTAYWSMVLILVGYFCFIIFAHFVRKEGKLPFYTLVMLILLAGVSIGAYNYSPRTILDSNEELAREEEQQAIEDEENLTQEEIFLKNVDKDLLDRFGSEKVQEAYGEDWSSYTFADMRLKKRVYGKLVWEESDFLTKLVGYEYPQMQHNGENFDLENDPHAILYYYGYIGAGLYLALLIYFMIRLFKQLICAFKESLDWFNFAILITWGLQMGLAVYTGYLLRRPNVSVYLMVILLLIHCRTKSFREGREA